MHEKCLILNIMFVTKNQRCKITSLLDISIITLSSTTAVRCADSNGKFHNWVSVVITLDCFKDESTALAS
jgi:hypothetical protein